LNAFDDASEALLLSSDGNTLHWRHMLTRAEEMIRCVVWHSHAFP